VEKLPPLFLPIDFVGLLKLNLNAQTDTHSIIFQYILDRPNFKNFVEEKFVEFDAKRRLDYILQSLGWKNFRDRLAGLYIEHVLYNRFPVRTSNKAGQEFRQFEDSLINYTVDGYNRGFMLAFYLKMAKLSSYQNVDVQNRAQFDISLQTFELLKHIPKKVIKIDWILLISHQLAEFLGFEKLLEILTKEKFDYKNIYNRLTNIDKKKYCDTLLNYAYAINENDFFVDTNV
jgi:hypothetical protein